MGQVQAATASHQEFAAERGHLVVDGDARAGPGQQFGCDQAGRSAADHGDAAVGRQAHFFGSSHVVPFAALPPDLTG